MSEAKIYYQEDCNLSLLEGKTIAVIGYGSQGHAHALNAKESGCNVIIGLYEGSKSWAKAEKQGFEVYTAAEAAKKADIIDLSDVITGKRSGRESDDDIIIYSVGGMPVEDIAWGDEVYRNARKNGIGVKLPLWDKPDMA